jgi:hypothetical protein
MACSCSRSPTWWVRLSDLIENINTTWDPESPARSIENNAAVPSTVLEVATSTPSLPTSWPSSLFFLSSFTATYIDPTYHFSSISVFYFCLHSTYYSDPAPQHP